MCCYNRHTSSVGCWRDNSYFGNFRKTLNHDWRLLNLYVDIYGRHVCREGKKSVLCTRHL